MAPSAVGDVAETLARVISPFPQGVRTDSWKVHPARAGLHSWRRVTQQTSCPIPSRQLVRASRHRGAILIRTRNALSFRPAVIRHPLKSEMRNENAFAYAKRMR